MTYHRPSLQLQQTYLELLDLEESDELRAYQSAGHRADTAES